MKQRHFSYHTGLIRLPSMYHPVGQIILAKRLSSHATNWRTIYFQAWALGSSYLCEVERSCIWKLVSLVPKRSLLLHCPREVWDSRWRHDRVQGWPSRERLGTRLEISDDLSRSQVELTLPTTFTFLYFCFFSLFCQRKPRVELFFFLLP